MSRILKKGTHSNCLGNEENGTPKLGIFVDAEESWCSKLYIDRKICENIEKWDSEWDKFIDASGHEEIRSSFCNYPYKKVCENVIFDTNPDKEKKKNYAFNFYVDNENNVRGDDCLIYIYSIQQQKMIIDGISTPDQSFFCFPKTAENVDNELIVMFTQVARRKNVVVYENAPVFFLYITFHFLEKVWPVWDSNP